MTDADKHYPNLIWPQFEVCNDDVTAAFEDMSRRLFTRKFLGEGMVPHSDHNNPGVEVLPILERPHSDGSKQRIISLQAKYFKGNVNYPQIKDSMKQTIKHYGGKLDAIYLFCNKPITTTAKGYKEIEALLKKSGIELYPISNTEVLDLVAEYKDIANYFFLPRRRPGDAKFAQIHEGIVINTSDDRECNLCPIRTNEKVIDSKLIQSLIQEKIKTCKSLVLEMQFDKLREEIDKIFT